MSEEKQIEEMAHDLCGRCQDGICVVDGKPCNLDLDCTCQINATTLYNAGYRKQSGEQRQIPCKIGDKVYGLKHDFLNVVDEMTVTEVGINGLFASEERVATAAKSSYLPYASLGDEWFLGKEDAYRERDRGEDNEQRKAD